MTDSSKRLIASLKHDPAYQALLSHLDEEVAEMLGALEEAVTPADVLRLTRLWQVARKLVSRLHHAPEEMGEAIRVELAAPSMELNHWGLPDDDPFIRVKRPVPPPYQAANE